MDSSASVFSHQPSVEDVDLDAMIDELLSIDTDLRSAGALARDRIDQINPAFQASALNLIHYLALRRRDVRGLQLKLSELGLSSLGRSEAHVLATIEAVARLLYALTGQPWTTPGGEPPVSVRAGSALLARNAAALLGPPPPGRRVRIMVTASTEVAYDLPLVVDMLEKGMNILRINCAHDNAGVWARMIDNLRRAEQIAGKTCLILMDLAGPKLRTGPVEPGPSVVKLRPNRNPLGQVITPARVWLGPDGDSPPAPVDATLTLPPEWLARRSAGEQVDFVDARAASRRLTLLEEAGAGWLATTDRTSYIVPGIHLCPVGGSDEPGVIGALPAIAGVLLLQKGDALILTRSLEPGRNAWTDDHGARHPARIGCTLPDVFELVQPGERIWFDDGKIGGIARRVDSEEIEIEITRARAGGSRLRAEKGINMPDSRLAIDPLTAKDLADLPFVASNADMIGLSFVQSAQDIANLRARVHELGDRRPGVVLKIETRRAFEQLPDLILESMGDPAAGIMIARGDLAVEVGFERLAEVQEEILWIAEAAHLPVIWATQVLETLAQSGLPSRSEITDAAMGERAECVMLNKGPYVVEAIDLLEDILGRMTEHQMKKRSMLRQLKSWTVEF